MIADELTAEFQAKAVPHSGGLLLLHANDAIALVRRAADLRIGILGVDGVFVSADRTVSPLEHVADFSNRGARCNGCWAEAEAFIRQRIGLGLVFEVTLGRTFRVADKEWLTVWGGLRAWRLWAVAILIGFIPAWLLLAPLAGNLMPGIAPGVPAFIVLACGASLFARRMWAYPCPRCSRPYGGWLGDPWPDQCSSCGLHTWAAPTQIATRFEPLPVPRGRHLDDRVRRTLAVVEIASGVTVTAVMAWFVAKYGMVGGWVAMAFESYAVLSIAAGLLLWRNNARGFELPEILQWLQIFRFQAPAFSFILAAGPEAIVSVSSGDRIFLPEFTPL